MDFALETMGSESVNDENSSKRIAILLLASLKVLCAMKTAINTYLTT